MTWKIVQETWKIWNVKSHVVLFLRNLWKNFQISQQYKANCMLDAEFISKILHINKALTCLISAENNSDSSENCLYIFCSQFSACFMTSICIQSFNVTGCFHHLNPCWLRSVVPYGATRPQGVTDKYWFDRFHFDGLEQERCKSSTLALELCLSYTHP